MGKGIGVDRNGIPVTPGDRVRLLEIRPSILQRLVGDELTDVSSMRGQVLEVFDVYEDGQVWVSLLWDWGDGKTEIHSIAVEPNAIELVTKVKDR
jgi:hypothetical protein